LAGPRSTTATTERMVANRGLAVVGEGSDPVPVVAGRRASPE
jgi:hypothetical protein